MKYDDEESDWYWEWDWRSLSNINISDIVISNPMSFMLLNLSAHPNITWKIIENNPDKPWNWDYISKNPNITWDTKKIGINSNWVDISINSNIVGNYSR